MRMGIMIPDLGEVRTSKTLQIESRHDANFVVAGAIVSYTNPTHC